MRNSFHRPDKSLYFLILTFSLSWILILLFGINGGEWYSSAGKIVAIVYMIIPALVVFFLETIIYKDQIQEKYAIKFRPNRWFLVAWLIMPLAAILSLGISVTFPGIEYSSEMEAFFQRIEVTVNPGGVTQESSEEAPVHPFWFMLIEGLIAGITLNALFSFGEELGWRGFLLYQLKKFSFLKSALVIGLIGGIWQAPLVLLGHKYPQHPVIGIPMIILWTILLSVIFNFIRIKSGSVIATAIMRGTLNGVFGISFMFLSAGNDLTIGLAGLSGLISISIIIAIIYWLDQHIFHNKIFHKTIEEVIA